MELDPSGTLRKASLRMSQIIGQNSQFFESLDQGVSSIRASWWLRCGIKIMLESESKSESKSARYLSEFVDTHGQKCFSPFPLIWRESAS